MPRVAPALHRACPRPCHSSRRPPCLTSSVADQIQILEEFTQSEPELFTSLRFATYFSYYELPSVIATLQAIGHDYNDAPQPFGYELPPFDPAINLPATPRGSYKKTDEIAAIDLSSLADLNLPVKGA